MNEDDEYSLRAATPGDGEAVSALLEASYPQLLAPDYDARLLAAALPLMTRANPRLLASGTYYVAEARGDAVVGCGGWSVEAPGGGDSKPGTAHIRHFATHPEWTRRGIGRALLKRCLEEARAQGVGNLECLSTLTAEAFYHSAGFVTVGPVDVPMSPTVGLPSVRMRLLLA
jgi:GNAT superfamily N-acetyltransferase